MSKRFSSKLAVMFVYFYKNLRYPLDKTKIRAYNCTVNL